jgi:hypothetical protein
VSPTLRRIAGAALLAAGLTLAGVELFTLVWHASRPDQYELIGRGGDILLVVLPAILLAAVTITLLVIWRLTRAQPLGPVKRFVLPGLAAAVSSYLLTAMLAVWVLVPIDIVNLVVRELITWALVGGAAWIGLRLVRPSAPAQGVS